MRKGLQPANPKPFRSTILAISNAEQPLAIFPCYCCEHVICAISKDLSAQIKGS